MNIQFECASYYDERYEIYHGKFEKIKSMLTKVKWSEIVHFGIDDKDVRDSKRKVGVEFNISSSYIITIVLGEGVDFELEEFCRGLYHYFNMLYGFRYLVQIDQWATAYAIGDWQHSDGACGITRKSKDILKAWNKKSELIKDGLLRDVYPENILSNAHINQLVNNMSLEEYIKRNAKGSLSSINSEIFVWKMNDDQLDEVRKYLYTSKIIIK